MRVSHRWLHELVDIPKETTPAQIAEKLTSAGLEVEGVEDLAAPLQGVVVGVVVTCDVHPQADKLHVCAVDIGTATVTIVCGAKNVAAGQRVCVAVPGTTLPGNKRIETAAVRGVVSNGMLCSLTELGLTDTVDGIHVLDGEPAAGTPAAGALHLDDLVFSLGITPNRPDALSHLGVARELAAALKTRLRSSAPTCAERGGPVDDLLTVLVEDGENCPRYGARVVEGIVVGPSPRWLQARLEACGVRPINNVVDVTNLVMMERGLPMHAFDADTIARIKNRAALFVRRARDQETIVTLDGKTRTLLTTDVVIADGPAEGRVEGGKTTSEILVQSPGRAIAIAGVMGGKDTEVTSTTTRVVLEAAQFSPQAVRKTARRLDLHSEASHRFERGTDPNGVAAALDRAASLLSEIAGGKEGARVARGIVDVYPKKVAPQLVSLRMKRAAQVLGVSPKLVDEASISKMLLSLGLEVDGREAEALRFRVPTFRPDLTREIDLIEELMRLLGTAAIPSTLPSRSTEAKPLFNAARATAVAKMKQVLRAAGVDEAVNLAFSSTTALERFGSTPIRVKNPIGEERAALRTTLIAGLLDNVVTNHRRGVEHVALYEHGSVFLRTNPQGQKPRTDDDDGPPGGDAYAIEQPRLSVVLSRTDDGLSPQRAFLAMKGLLSSMMQALGVRVDDIHAELLCEPTTATGLHPRATAHVVVVKANHRTHIGTLGELHPDVRAALGLKHAVVVAEIDVDAVTAIADTHVRVTALPRFPAVRRDLAFIVEAAMPVGTLCARVRSHESVKDLIEQLDVFDVYQGANLPTGKKSVAVALVLRAADRTLQEDDLLRVTQMVIDGAEVRAQ
jgi:phenylalanyl-tRNA synthetase beta chain